MIREGQGNLLACEVDALVNTVNTVGVMGKGVALQFRQAFPENYKAYSAACRKHEVNIGRMFVTLTGMLQPRFIINFPTKRHWRGQAKLEDIQSGLKNLIRVVAEKNIRSIALPPLGCGLGGLLWEDVKPLIEAAFATVPDVDVILFPPGQVVPARERVIRTARPEMTSWRAALIRLIDVYSQLAFEATHLEAQKLLYFLVEAGEQVKVNFAKGEYGPFDSAMKFAIQQMNGHYVYGFGDGRRLDPVTLAPGAIEEAIAFLNHSAGTDERIQRITNLIEGFETPYGLELLATVHWVASHEDSRARTDVDRAIALSYAWNDRKRKALKERDLRIAWERLKVHGWLDAP